MQHRLLLMTHPGLLIVLAALAGVVSGCLGVPVLNGLAGAVSELFIRLLKLVSTPIIFFSVLSTLCGMGSLQKAGALGGRVLSYTLLTTVTAATIALGLLLLIDPAGGATSVTAVTQAAAAQPETGYWQYALNVIPSNFLQPFLEGQVISVLFMAIVLSFAILALPDQQRERLHGAFEDIFAAIMKLTSGILKLLPIAVWAFITLFVESLEQESMGSQLVLYFLCIVLANLIQAAVVLPLLMISKGLSPWHTFRGMLPALTVAFFAKSSSAALPASMAAAQERLGISSGVARFSLPLCTTINMNACAGFILITVLFVSMLNGVSFSPMELVAWVVIATIAAVGNAGVPMGCFLLASTLLATMNVPIELMGVILPVYALIDMMESAINVWSDACVTAIVDRDLAKKNVQQLV